MNCTSARDHLSAYFDDELSLEMRADVAEHLQSCAHCSAALARIRSLSGLAQELPSPTAENLWSSIERELRPPAVAEPLPMTRTGARRRVWWALGIGAVAASLLVGFLARPSIHPYGSHDPMGVNLSRYIEQFRSDPSGAEQFLRHQYVGQSIEPGDAVRLVSYKPLAPEQLSDGIVRSQTYLFEMPCCKCIQTLYRRPDGGSLAVFEHVDEVPAWFGKRSTLHTNCSHKDVCLVECDGQLAVTWKQGKRFITLVGVKDLEEVSRLVPAFADTTS